MVYGTGPYMGWFSPRSFWEKAYWRKLKGCRETGTSQWLEWGLRVRRQGRETHPLFFYFAHKYFLYNENVFCNVKTTQKYFYGFCYTYWCFLPHWNMGCVVEECQKCKWIGLVGQRSWRFCMSAHGKRCRPLSREAMVRPMFLKDLANGVRVNRKG